MASARADGKVPARILFPVVGPVQYTDDFGDPRPQGRHEGIDIVAPKRALAVAAEAGTVKFWTTSWAAGCMLYLYGKSGTTYLYVHLNNDLTRRNDNRGKCAAGVSYAPGLKSGVRVAAGQPIGFVGDSGDADGIHAHLHFELHPNDGRAVDPYKWLNSASHLLFAAPAGTTYTLSLAGTIVSTSPTSLKLQVKALREWSTGLTMKKVGRTLALDVPIDAAIQAAPRNGVPGKKMLLAQARKGKPALIWTQPGKVTLAAERGDPLAISAGLVLLYP